MRYAILSVLLLAIVVAVACGSGGSAQPTPTPPASETTSTPEPAAETLAFLRDGDIWPLEAIQRQQIWCRANPDGGARALAGPTAATLGGTSCDSLRS